MTKRSYLFIAVLIAIAITVAAVAFQTLRRQADQVTVVSASSDTATEAPATTEAPVATEPAVATDAVTLDDGEKPTVKQPKYLMKPQLDLPPEAIEAVRVLTGALGEPKNQRGPFSWGDFRIAYVSAQGPIGEGWDRNLSGVVTELAGQQVATLACPLVVVHDWDPSVGGERAFLIDFAVPIPDDAKIRPPLKARRIEPVTVLATPPLPDDEEIAGATALSKGLEKAGFRTDGTVYYRQSCEDKTTVILLPAIRAL